MSVINPGSNLEFKSTDSLFARIRKRLKSFDAVGILDEGDWYYHIKELVDKLGVSVYDEHEAVLFVKNYKAPLPDNFTHLYAAYKCSHTITSDSKATLHPQRGMVFYIDHTIEQYQKCDTNCGMQRVMTGDKETFRFYIEGVPSTLTMGTPHLLRLSGNAKGICDTKCANLFAQSAHEITIDKGFVYTNFNDDTIFMKYYGLALDPESGLPMIPDNTFVEKAIEDYIVYRIFEDFYFNGEVPDIDRKLQLAKLNYEDSLKQALYWCKMPSFQNAINKIRVDRKKLSVYQQTR